MIDKTTLKQEADKLFASTTHEVLWGSPAGEFFTSEKIGRLSLKEGQKLIKFEKTETKELSAIATIAFIKVATSLEAIKPLEADERKSVKEAYDKRVIELTAEINVNLDDKGEGTGNGNADTEAKK